MTYLRIIATSVASDWTIMFWTPTIVRCQAIEEGVWSVYLYNIYMEENGFLPYHTMCNKYMQWFILKQTLYFK